MQSGAVEFRTETRARCHIATEEWVVVTIKIMNEFPHGPVWTCEEETGIETDALPLVHNDPTVAAL